MNIHKPLFLLIIFCALSALSTGLRADVTVFAAASLKNALDQVQKHWSAQKGGRVVIAGEGNGYV